jgi:hypothetical protein
MEDPASPGMLALSHKVMVCVDLHNHAGKPKITIKTLCDGLKTISDWDKIVQMMTNLDIEDYKLEAIKANNDTIEERRRKAFRLWLQQTPNASWDPIIVALRAVGEMTLAEELERKYQWKEPRV